MATQKRLNSEQLAELKLQQQSGEEGTLLTSRTDSSYKFSSHEKGLVHARILQGGFNPETGEPLGTAFVQKFGVEEFKRMEDQQAFAGAKVEILHDGGEAVEGVEPDNHLQPKIVSEPGAGTPLVKDQAGAFVPASGAGTGSEEVPTAEQLMKKTKPELIAQFSTLYPEREAEASKMNKEELAAEISDRLRFQAEEKR